MNFLRTLILPIVTLTLASMGLSQEKVLLQVKGKEGLFGRYSSETTVTMALGGEKATIVSKETYKRTVTKVDADGTVTFEEKSESSEQTFNGEKMPDDGSSSTTTMAFRPNGTLVSFKSDDEDDESKLGVRLLLAQRPVFSDKPVGVGDKWTITYKPDSALGTRAATGKFSLSAFEDVGTAKCAKVSLEFSETGASPAMTNKMTLWVEIASGDVVKGEYAFDNVPLPGPEGDILGQARGEDKRTAGGPMPESGPPAAAQAEGKKISDVTKGCEKIDGVYTFYKKREGGRQTIYMEIKESQLGQLNMLQATAGSGNSRQLVVGNPIGDLVFRFDEVQPDKVTMVVPNLGYRANPGSPEELAVRKSFAESFLDQFNVEARSKETKSLLIDVSDLFRGDIARLSAMFSGGSPFGLSMGPSYSLDREKTFVQSVKAFPKNVAVESVYNLVGGGPPSLEQMLGGSFGDSRSQVVRVMYNLFPLDSQSTYRPRRFDPRVGYFTIWYQDFSLEKQSDQTVQSIVRWDVRKKDPAATLSDPVEPIVFYLDNAIPVEHREPIKEGVLLWNKAFEKIGLKNVIDVRQMPADADWDPADMRYNTVRWVTSPSDAYAVSLFRSNPVTGQIVNGSILIDANVVRFVASERNSVVAPTSHLDHRHGRCSIVEMGRQQAELGYIAAKSLGVPGATVTLREYLAQFLRHTVAHEFGHMLGLRHNFVASTELTLDQLKDGQTVAEAQTSSSVMDYVPFNVSALGQNGVDFYARGLGKYDFWALEYGYRDFGSSEAAGLASLASRGGETGLGYQTDEAVDGIDPYVTRFDLGAKPLDYWLKLNSVCRSLISTLGVRKPAKGESYWTFTQELMMALSMQAKASSELTRFLGGVRKFSNFRGDKDERPVIAPVPLADQQAALEAICRTILVKGAFPIPKGYFERLTDNPNADPVESFLSGQNPFAMLDLLANLQGRVLDQLFAADRLSLIVNNEFRATKKDGSLTLGTVLGRVHGAVWSELSTGSSIDTLRRELQRKHLDLLIRTGVRGAGVPADARMWSWKGLSNLKSEIAAGLQKTTDATTRVHLEECAMRIDRALNAQQTVGG